VTADRRAEREERGNKLMVMDPALYCTWGLFTLLFCCARAHLSLPAIGGWYGGGGMAIHMARYYMAVAAEQTLLADRWIDLEVKKKDDELIITSCLIDNIISFAIAF
jgi:hypothetical protein